MSESLAAETRPLGIAVTLAELGPFASGSDPHLGAEALLTVLCSADRRMTERAKWQGVPQLAHNGPT